MNHMAMKERDGKLSNCHTSFTRTQNMLALKLSKRRCDFPVVTSMSMRYSASSMLVMASSNAYMTSTAWFSRARLEPRSALSTTIIITATTTDTNTCYFSTSVFHAVPALPPYVPKENFWERRHWFLYMPDSVICARPTESTYCQDQPCLQNGIVQTSPSRPRESRTFYNMCTANV